MSDRICDIPHDGEEDDNEDEDNEGDDMSCFRHGSSGLQYLLKRGDNVSSDDCFEKTKAQLIKVGEALKYSV